MPNIAIHDVSLFVRTMGDGYPIVLMHGGPGLDHTTLLALAPLARDYQLVFYDHRCNGRSSGDPETMTWDSLTGARRLSLSTGEPGDPRRSTA